MQSFYLQSCKPTSSNNTENAIIPLDVGNCWTYKRIFNYDSVSNINTNVNTITGIDTINDSLLTYKFESIYIEDTIVDTGYEWCNLKDDVLISYGYDNAGFTFGLPCYKRNETINFKGKQFNSPIEVTQFLLGNKSIKTSLFRSDSNFFYDPVEVLQYPLKIGNEWYYRDYDPWPMLKKVVSKEVITVEAGEFECYKIKWFWDLNTDGIWDDDIDGFEYISVDGYGLIQRIFYYYGVENENLYDKTELLEYNLIEK